MIRKAETKNRLRALKLTQLVDGEPRFRRDAPTLVPVEDLVRVEDLDGVTEAVAAIIESFRSSLSSDRKRLLDQYRYVHAARKGGWRWKRGEPRLGAVDGGA